MSELPDSWFTAPLGELLSTIVGGGTPSKANPDYFRGSIPFMTVKDMHERFIADTQDHITEQALDSSASTLIPADTLVVASRMSLGKIARPQIPVAINQDLKALFLHGGIDKTYIEYAWRAKESQIQAMGTGTTVKGIRLEDIRGLEIPVAPSAEQTRIANQLDKLLARIQSCNDRLDAIPALLKRFRQAVLSAATSGALTEDWRAGTEPSYRYVSLGALISDGPQNGLYKHSSSYGTGTGILRIDMFYDGEVTGWDVMKRLKVDASELDTYGLSVGDIVVNRVNSPPYVGKAALIRELAEPTVFESNMMRIRLDNNQVLPEYCIRFLSSPEGLLQLRRNVKHAVNQSSINQTDVKSVQVPLPCLAEQAEIVRRVQALFKLADRIEARYTAARAQAQRLSPLLLAKAFRGELVPQDPNDEPASELLARLSANTAHFPAKPRRGRQAISKK